MKTGQKSNKRKDIVFHEAVEDPETRAEYIRSENNIAQDHCESSPISLLDLQKLHALTKDFMKAIVGSVALLPYGVRCIARDTLLTIRV